MTEGNLQKAVAISSKSAGAMRRERTSCFRRPVAVRRSSMSTTLVRSHTSVRTQLSFLKLGS